ncbi:MAG: hypothetical protein WBG36_09855 [Ornithinimicrobium sp.]
MVVGDTGPFLCAGAVRREHGLHVLFQRYNTDDRSIAMPRQVADELTNQARGSGKLGTAAIRARKSAFLKVEDREWTDAEWNRVEDLVVAYERKRAEIRGKVAKTTDHDGDVAGILFALDLDALFLTNDIPAQQAARDLGLRTATFAMVLAAEVRDRRLSPEEAVTALETIAPLTYSGISNPSVNAITTQPVVEGV